MPGGGVTIPVTTGLGFRHPASGLLFGRMVHRIVQEAIQQQKTGDTFANILMVMWSPTELPNTRLHLKAE